MSTAPIEQFEGPWTVILPWQRLPLSANNRLHWRAKANRIAAIRDDVMVLAFHDRLPKGLGRAHVELHHCPGTRRTRDLDNAAPTLKAICDGLALGKGKVHGYGLVADDDAAHLSSEYVLEPVDRDCEHRFWLEITERLVEEHPA